MIKLFSKKGSGGHSSESPHGSGLKAGLSEDVLKQQQFLELLRPINDKLARFCRAMAKDSDEAKDLVSETILLAYQSFSNVREHKAFQSYLFTIASRLNQQRSKRSQKFEPISEHHAAVFHTNGTSAEVTLDVDILYKALARLPEKQREAIVLFEISGLSMEEIRGIQGGSLSGVKSRIARGRGELTVLLRDRESLAKPSTLKSGNGSASEEQVPQSLGKDPFNSGMNNYLAFTMEGKV